MDKFKFYVMYFTFQEREKRAYSRYAKERTHLELMSSRELSFNYVTVKARYEHKKNIYSFFIATILLMILTGSWGIFYKIIKKMLEIMISNQANSEELAKIGVAIFTIIFGLLLLSILVFVVFYLKSLHELHKQLLLIEDVKKEEI